MDIHEFDRGMSFDAYEYFGAHVYPGGVRFRLWAPRAEKVTLMGEFSRWREAEMGLNSDGIWELSFKGAGPGQMYKYVVYSKAGRTEHSDPYGFGMELRPGSASVIRTLGEYKFSDSAWMKKRTKCYDRPLNIYELQLGSWRKKGWQWYSYEELAGELIAYLKGNGYTHVEFMPLAEYPFDGSWGYQGLGYFAPTSRFGTADQLKSLIDRLHREGIGAILDFVPVHFATDGYGLKNLDGAALYEYPGQRGRSEWGSRSFDHGRAQVRSFLQSAANYWLKEFHFDGLRVDAVSRLIFHRGDWTRGENAEGLMFLKNMNAGLSRLNPTAMLIAEDSTAFEGVTRAVQEGGLGFDYKWDLGWTYNTLKYFDYASSTRGSKGTLISAALNYSRRERFILPLSHDEGMLASRLRGNDEDKLRQGRLLLLYQACHPGKKLNFMGNEFFQRRPWHWDKGQDWGILGSEEHAAFLRFASALNALYIKKKALWVNDFGPDNFQWLNCRSQNPCVFGFSRPMGQETMLVFLNFSDKAAIIEPDVQGSVSMLINSDWQDFGGKTKKAARRRIMKRLPAYSGVIYSCK